MKDLILQNTGNWVQSARITYIKALEPFPYVMHVDTGRRFHTWMTAFKTIRAAKNNFTRQYYKGIWKEEKN